MKNRTFILIGLVIVGSLIGAGLWLSQSKSGIVRSITSFGNDSPTEAYKRLYSAVKSKDTETIKGTLTQKSIDLGVMAASRNNVAPEKVYENGFTATTFATSLPEIRDERIKDNMGAVEVWNSKENKWEDLPFILEDGVWKLAIGDLFANTYESPGHGRDYLEREAANAVSGPKAPVASNPNTNTNSIPINPSADKPGLAKKPQ